jgi:dethiobiotin synthetase
MNGIFVTATGTGVGKTFVSRGLARSLARRGLRVAALKPIETGCAPDPTDAIALARACGRPELAHARGFHRIRSPVAPLTGVLAGEEAPPAIPRLAEAIVIASLGYDFTLVECAGGIGVPVLPRQTIADLAVALSLPLLLVSADTLGVLSHVITACESAERRSLRVAAVILTQFPKWDPSRPHNARILSDHLGLPVHPFDATSPNADDDTLAAIAESTGLTDLVLSPPTRPSVVR